LSDVLFILAIIIITMLWPIKLAIWFFFDAGHRKSRDTLTIKVPTVYLWNLLILALICAIAPSVFSSTLVFMDRSTVLLQGASFALTSTLLYQACARHGTVTSKTFNFPYNRERENTVSFHFQLNLTGKSLDPRQRHKALMQEAPAALIEIAKCVPACVTALTAATPWCAPRHKGNTERTSDDLFNMLRTAFPDATIEPTRVKLGWLQSILVLNFGAQKETWRHRFPEKRWWERLEASGYTVYLQR